MPGRITGDGDSARVRDHHRGRACLSFGGDTMQTLASCHPLDGIMNMRTIQATVNSPVCMGIPPVGESEENRFREETVYVTPEAQEILAPSHIWFHLGGWSDEGDTYDTQESQFTQDLERFWSRLVGPDEQLRRDLMTAAERITPKWKAVTLSANGTVRIRFRKGKAKVVRRPTR